MPRVAWRNLTLWKQIGVFIRWAREFRGFTQEKLAKKANIDLKYLKRMERGKTESVTLEEIFRIKEALKVPIDQIIPNLG